MRDSVPPAYAERPLAAPPSMLDDPRFADRLRRGTDDIGRGLYTGPERRASARTAPHAERAAA